MIAISIFTAKILLFVLGCACLVGVALIGYVKEIGNEIEPERWSGQ